MKSISIKLYSYQRRKSEIKFLLPNNNYNNMINDERERVRNRKVKN